MIRILFFILLVLGLALGFAWLADRPGELSLIWQGQRIEMSLMRAASILISLFAAVLIVIWLIRAIWLSPHTVTRYFRARKRDRGYQTLSTGLIAAGAGNANIARKMAARSRSLISADQEPLIHLLEAQTALIEGKYDDARKKFELMADDPETRELGLRGSISKPSGSAPTRRPGNMPSAPPKRHRTSHGRPWPRSIIAVRLVSGTKRSGFSTRAVPPMCSKKGGGS